MHFIISFFQTLRGKLILTYTTVTVLALLALEITVLLVAFIFTRGLLGDTQSYLSDVVAILPAQARTYLQPGANDLPGLQTWLQATYTAGYASLPPQGLLDSPAAPIIRSEPMYVLSPQGIVLAEVPAGKNDLTGRKYTPPASIKRSADILTNALNKHFDPYALAALKPDGNYLMALPVTAQSVTPAPPGADRDLVAVIIVTVAGPPPMLNTWWPVLLGIVLLTGLVLLMAVTPFGALFGLIMSSGLTRRLKALTRAADAWSEGDFSVQPQDRSKDEISYLGLRMRRMAEHIQALLQTQHELTLLEERNRLARELHDTVKQTTFATLMQVRAAKNLVDQDPAAARLRLDEAEELIKNSQQELGLMIAELRPAGLEDQGLAEALRQFLATWSQHACIPAEIQVQNERRLPFHLEQTLYRVAQEALSNAARHSRASAVTVNLAYAHEQVVLSIADNGIGFDPASTEIGIGIQSMRERMGGRLEIHSVLGAGTTVIARADDLQSS